MQSRATHRCPKAQGWCRECSRALGVTRSVANALQRRHPLAAGKHPHARKASTASATGGHLSRSTPSSTRPSSAAEETVTVIRRYAMPNALLRKSPDMMTLVHRGLLQPGLHAFDTSVFLAHTDVSSVLQSHDCGALQSSRMPKTGPFHPTSCVRSFSGG